MFLSSLSTLVKISKTAGPMLRPHISVLVVALLESLSTLEPQYLNYLALQVSSSQDTQEKVRKSEILYRYRTCMYFFLNIPRPNIEHLFIYERAK